LKRAALFSALTGLRFSDISKLVWSEVQYSELEGYFLQFRQKKTKGVEVLPISEQAFKLLGERKEPTAKVFEGLIYSAYLNVHLKQWILRAGITKDITFHCFRHTFATLLVRNDVSPVVVQKLMRHSDIRLTMNTYTHLDLADTAGALAALFLTIGFAGAFLAGPFFGGATSSDPGASKVPSST